MSEMSPELLREMEIFYRDRATKELNSLKRVLEAQIGPNFDSELSGKIVKVSIALEAIRPKEQVWW